MSAYEKIKNPETGRYVSIYGKIGRKVLANYIEAHQYGGTEKNGTIYEISTDADIQNSKDDKKHDYDNTTNIQFIFNKLHEQLADKKYLEINRGTMRAYIFKFSEMKLILIYPPDKKGKETSLYIGKYTKSDPKEWEPFTSSDLGALCNSIGINLDDTDPDRPEQNNKEATANTWRLNLVGADDIESKSKIEIKLENFFIYEDDYNIHNFIELLKDIAEKQNS